MLYNFKGSTGEFDVGRSSFATCGKFVDDPSLPDVYGKSHALVGLSEDVKTCLEFLHRVSRDTR